MIPTLITNRFAIQVVHNSGSDLRGVASVRIGRRDASRPLGTRLSNPGGARGRTQGHATLKTQVRPRILPHPPLPNAFRMVAGTKCMTTTTNNRRQSQRRSVKTGRTADGDGGGFLPRASYQKCRRRTHPRPPIRFRRPVFCNSTKTHFSSHYCNQIRKSFPGGVYQLLCGPNPLRFSDDHR